MSWDHGVIKSSIWADEDFRLLRMDAQHLFFLLVSQPTITSCGIVPLTPGRWSLAACDMTPALVRASLDRLVEARYVVIDEATEELLVRTFVKHSGVLRMPNVVVGMAKQYDTILSRPIRQRFFEQFPADFLEGLPEGFAERLAEPFRKGFANAFPEPPWEGSGEGLPEGMGILQTTDALLQTPDEVGFQGEPEREPVPVVRPKRPVVERLFEVYRIAYGEQAGYWQPPSTGKALVLNDVRKAAIDKARKSYSDDGIAAALRGWRFVKWMATTTFEKDGTEHPPAELHTILHGKHIETCQQAWDRHAAQSVPS